MYNDIHTMHSTCEAVAVAYIANKITQVLLVKSSCLHLILLEFVAAKYNHLFWIALSNKNFNEFLPERAGPPSDKYNLVFPVHEYSFYFKALKRPVSLAMKILQSSRKYC